MALQLVDLGPKMDWTMDNKIYDRYLIWKSDVELIFSSALSDATALQKSSYLKLWMGREGKPLLNKWVSTGRIEFSNPEEIAATGGRPKIPQLNGFIVQTFWDLLEEELKPKGNKLISILELLSNKSKQGSKSSYVYNLVETCNYGDFKDRIIRDILFNGCASSAARDKIIRKGDRITLAEVLEILHAEDAASSTHETLREIGHSSSNLPFAQVNMVSYEKNKKSREKPSFTEQNTDSTNSKRLCYRCRKPYSKEHEPVCKAQNATCNACGKDGHFQKVCRTTGKQKSSYTKKAHIVQIVPSDGYYNEAGVSTSTSTSPQENQVSTSSGSKLHAIDMEKQPIQQTSDADADTYYKKVSSFYFQKNPRNTSTNVLQRKGEVTLSFPIDSNQFQQFCKQLNTKEIILCTDLLQQELYGK